MCVCVSVCVFACPVECLTNEISVALISSGRSLFLWGTHHYCGEGSTTWYRFAEAIFKIAKKYEAFSVREVIPITTDEYPTPVKRSTNSLLDCSKIESNFVIGPRPWVKSLTDKGKDKGRILNFKYLAGDRGWHDKSQRIKES